MREAVDRIGELEVAPEQECLQRGRLGRVDSVLEVGEQRLQHRRRPALARRRDRPHPTPELVEGSSRAGQVADGDLGGRPHLQRPQPEVEVSAGDDELVQPIEAGERRFADRICRVVVAVEQGQQGDVARIIGRQRRGLGDEVAGEGFLGIAELEGELDEHFELESIAVRRLLGGEAQPAQSTIVATDDPLGQPGERARRQVVPVVGGGRVVGDAVVDRRCLVSPAGQLERQPPAEGGRTSRRRIVDQSLGGGEAVDRDPELVLGERVFRGEEEDRLRLLDRRSGQRLDEVTPGEDRTATIGPVVAGDPIVQRPAEECAEPMLDRLTGELVIEADLAAGLDQQVTIERRPQQGGDGDDVGPGECFEGLQVERRVEQGDEFEHLDRRRVEVDQPLFGRQQDRRRNVVRRLIDVEPVGGAHAADRERVASCQVVDQGGLAAREVGAEPTDELAGRLAGERSELDRGRRRLAHGLRRSARRRRTAVHRSGGR